MMNLLASRRTAGTRHGEYHNQAPRPSLTHCRPDHQDYKRHTMPSLEMAAVTPTAAPLARVVWSLAIGSRYLLVSKCEMS